MDWAKPCHHTSPNQSLPYLARTCIQTREQQFFVLFQFIDPILKSLFGNRRLW